MQPKGDYQKPEVILLPYCSEDGPLKVINEEILIKSSCQTFQAIDQYQVQGTLTEYYTRYLLFNQLEDTMIPGAPCHGTLEPSLQNGRA